jgi:hypothetical protein
VNNEVNGVFVFICFSFSLFENQEGLFTVSKNKPSWFSSPDMIAKMAGDATNMCGYVGTW